MWSHVDTLQPAGSGRSKHYTFQLWDIASGAVLAVGTADADWLGGGVALPDGRLLLRANDKKFRLWNGRMSSSFEVVPKEQVAGQHPEWVHALMRAQGLRTVALGAFAAAEGRLTILRHRASAAIRAIWHAESESEVRCLSPDGFTLVTQADKQMCFLKLYHGSRRITLEELEVLLPDSWEERC